MPLTSLKILNLRNIAEASLKFSEEINVISGQNGSGKTSLLEAIHLLGMGRSFRTRVNSNIVTKNQDNLAISGAITTKQGISLQAGLEKFCSGTTNMRLAGESVVAAKLAESLPLQLISPNSYLLLDSGPAHRRKFLDWGAFYVEPAFYNTWKNYSRALKNRNQLLKEKAPRAEIAAWTKELLEHGLAINTMRNSFVEHFKTEFTEIIDGMLELEQLEIKHKPGWNQDKTLAEALSSSIDKDILYGRTQFGPHRADISFICNELPADEVLSRGQQKLFVCAMYLAQSRCLKKLANKNPIYLIDDLSSELDDNNQAKLISGLRDQNCQLFITCINPIKSSWLNEFDTKKMFHMDHGLAKEVL